MCCWDILPFATEVSGSSTGFTNHTGLSWAATRHRGYNMSIWGQQPLKQQSGLLTKPPEGKWKCTINRWDRPRTHGRSWLTVLSFCHRELLFRGHNQGKDSNNGGNYLISFCLNTTQICITACQTKYFIGTWVKIYTEIITAVADVVDWLLRWIDYWYQSFAEQSIIFHYVSDSNVVKDKFKDVTEGRRCHSPGPCIFRGYNCLEGVAATASNQHRVHAKVKMKILLALWNLCYSHLNLYVALNQGAAKMTGCQKFFLNLTDLHTCYI